MPAKVTLRVTQGKLAGADFQFDERTTCIIGRADDCSPRVPNDTAHKTISRHHCLLDINPPDVRIRDFGSLNGTFVNGKKIGQREKGQTPTDAAKIQFPEHDLKDGDEIKLGDTVFQVGLFVPAYCAECSIEISEENRTRAERAPGVYQCDACREKAEKAKRKEPPKPKPKVCAKCGRDVSGEVGEHRHGDYVCVSCKADPLAILKRLLALAKTGDYSVLGIRGYEIIKELGRGGMGAVYLARHEATKKQVALKVMLPEVAADERAKALFLRETENTKALKHRNIVELWDAGCSEGTFFFTLELCDGGSAEKLIEARRGPLSINDAAPIILQVLDGLDYAHHAKIPYVRLKNGSFGPGTGLVHRDIKPQNIFLSGTGSSRVAKLGDYGLAKAFDAAGLSGLTRTGAAMGTPQFMPRQQVINFKHAQPEVDVWAAAASFYFMITGRFPRDFTRGKDVWQTVLQSSVVPIRKRAPSITKRLADVIDAALQDNPEIGFKTAMDFKRALEGVL
jgi:serine/threonine-protein kinase